MERGQALRQAGQLVPFEFCMQFNFVTARRVRDIATRTQVSPCRPSSHSPGTSTSPTALLRQGFRTLLSGSEAQSSVDPRVTTGEVNSAPWVYQPQLGSTQQLSSPNQTSTPYRGYQTPVPPLQHRLEHRAEPAAICSPAGLQSVGTTMTSPEQAVRPQLAPLRIPPLTIPAECRSPSSTGDRWFVAEANHGLPTKRHREHF